MNPNIQKVLILGKRGGILQWQEHILAAQQKLPETELQGFAFNHNNLFERAHKKLMGFINKSTKNRITAKNLNRAIINFKPELIIIADLFYLSDEVIKVLRTHKENYKIAHWIGDFFDQRLLRSKDIINAFYFTDSDLLIKAQEIGIRNSFYLPLAFNPRIFQKPKSTDRKSELLFIGAWSKNRETIIRNINSPMLIIGKGWQRIQDTPHQVISHNISNTQVAKLYQQYACVLNIINSENISNGLNMRCFEAPACGALLITDKVKDLADCYQDNEVITYNTANELDELYNNLLLKPQNITRIAENGYKRAIADHTYANRIHSIIKNHSSQ